MNIKPTPSMLQKVSRAVNYTLGFRLQYLHFLSDMRHLPLSITTRKLIAQHEKITLELKLAIRRDYVDYREKVRAESAKLSKTK